MKKFIQIVTLVGLVVSGWYSYKNDFSFEGVVAFLSFLIAFGSTFFLGVSNKMSQTLGDNSKGYQSGRDINIKD
ncbi:hypothetical protein [Photobacterium atrarenae]|uniref:Uncharacterized protein n=1 Tax=Photobacterium atrarenae TaxID=865757 RepID=A0ABY5GB69_9GAMM|nr:hypothetical protein [Photobacterium atrarenae]UTV26423.1 hypothetical protein NNL38_08510 [Photobacterium atrarenae]